MRVLRLVLLLVSVLLLLACDTDLSDFGKPTYTDYSEPEGW